MKKSDLFLMAIQNLKNRKTRTRLTVIGVIIGTCAIVIMVSIGIGIDKTVTSQYESNSTLSKITVYGIADETEGNGSEGSDSMPFDDSAVEYFKGIENVKMVMPMFEASEYVNIERGKYCFQSSVMAIDFDLMEKIGYELKEGSFENADKRGTVFFGQSSVTNFMDAQGNIVKYKYDEDYNITDCEIDLMKDNITISPKINTIAEEGTYSQPSASSSLVTPQRVKVAGVLKQNYRIDYNTDYAAYIDLSYAKELMRQSRMLSNTRGNNKFSYSEIDVFVDSMQNVAAVKETLQNKGFSCYSDDEELEYTKKVMKIVQLVLGGIGAISMFVAAFGISNTMVMSVYERTKEIGIMKVLGCDLKDIKKMFLYEAGTIGFLGGAIGMLISYILSIIANLVARAVAANMQIGEDITVCVSSIPPWLAILGILFSVLVGVIAGLAPAKRSVNVSALTAIHNE